MRLSTCLLLLLGVFVLETTCMVHASHVKTRHCSKHQPKIGGVLEQSSRVGREQKIAMEMAVHDFCKIMNDTCSCPILQLKDSQGDPARSYYEVMDLMKGQVQAIIGTIGLQEASLVSEFDKATKNIPIISLTPIATSSFPESTTMQSFFQISHDVKIHMQCIASIVGHFSWRKVTPIYEDHSTFRSGPGLLTLLSDALEAVDSTIERPFIFPPLHSLSNPSSYINKELKKLKMKENRVFVLLKSSPRSCFLFFKIAKKLGMMEKGYVWIISDEISSLLDSADQSVIMNMQGVVGFKTKFADTGEHFGKFKLQFRKRYRNKYPNEEHLNPSIYALRAYDATSVVVKAIQVSNGSSSSMNLSQSITHAILNGVSGSISFKDGKLAQLPTFRIINVIGRSYRDIEFWSPEFGFLNDKLGTGEDNLNLIYWPGGTQGIPIGRVQRNEGKPLKIGVPARGAFKQFVNVSYDPSKNETYVTGFSINVFKAAVKKLNYSLSYVFIPYNGSYDDMVAEVHNKTLDAVVGDTEIMADRYEYVEFSQPYMESGLVMVVPLKPNPMKERFIFFYAFTTKLWIILLAMTIGTVSVVWLNEHVHGNKEFVATSTFEYISKMLWFAVAVLSFAHRELISNNLSRLVLATWFCVNVIVAACFTATLSSIITISKFQPSLDLQRSNAFIGCNRNSFIIPYLVNVLNYKPEKIRQINSIDDYDGAFKKGEISAAFFVVPHANVFLKNYCHGYEKFGHTHKLGGFGFVFRKGSPLVDDISKAVLKVTQSGEVNTLEDNMLGSFSNCSGAQDQSGGSTGLDLGLFAGLFMISGSISIFVFLTALARVVLNRWEPIQTNLNLIARIGNWWRMLLQIRIINGRLSVELTPNQVVP